jgi:ABC-2 type transport system ATP-binding protein
VTLTASFRRGAWPPGAGLAGPGRRTAVPLPVPGSAVPAVSIAGVSARYHGADKLSVDRLDLVIPPGIVFGLLGENGSGKTTTINMIAGFMEPSQGSVRVFGHKPGSDQAKDCMGVVTQETALYDQLSVRDYLGLFAALYPSIPRKEKPRRVEEAMHLAGLTEEAGKKAGDLSGGMARRLQIARALQHHPRLIVLDEPTLGVDTRRRAELWEHIRQLRAQGITVLLTTNVMEEAAALCDQVAIMHHGRLVTAGTPENLRRGRGTFITATIEAVEEDMELAYAALNADPAVTDVTITPARVKDRYLVRVTAGARDGIDGLVIMHLTDCGAVIRTFSARTATLEEAFLTATGSFKAVR